MYRVFDVHKFALFSIVAAIACRNPSEIDDGSSDESVQSEETEDSAEPKLQGAHDIEIAQIEVQQGIPLIVSDGKSKIESDDEEIFLLDHRRTLFRVHFDLSDDWVEREITARLILEKPDDDGGEAKIYEIDSTELVRWDSRPNYISDTFYWLVSPEIIEPGLRYAVELYETEENSEKEEQKDDTPPRYPSEGTDALSISDEKLKLEIKFVPIRYTGGGGDVLPDLSDEVIKKITENVIAKNPISEDELVYSIDDPLEFADPLDNLGDILPVLQEAKLARKVPSHVYYHGIVYTNGANAVKSVAGIAFIAQQHKNNGQLRIGTTVLGNRLGTTADTLTHEIGHNQGLRHVECPQAESAGPDPSFPYKNGHIGSPGYDIFGAQLHTPISTYDYMSYCTPIFVADWTWKKTQKRIREITAWSGARQIEQSTNSRIIYGLLNDAGRESWWSLDGTLPSNQEIAVKPGQCRTTDGQSIELRGVQGVLSDDRSRWVAFEVPSNLACTAVSLSHGAGFRTIPMTDLGSKPLYFAAKSSRD